MYSLHTIEWSAFCAEGDQFLFFQDKKGASITVNRGQYHSMISNDYGVLYTIWILTMFVFKMVQQVIFLLKQLLCFTNINFLIVSSHNMVTGNGLPYHLVFRDRLMFCKSQCSISSWGFC